MLLFFLACRGGNTKRTGDHCRCLKSLLLRSEIHCNQGDEEIIGGVFSDTVLFKRRLEHRNVN
jgi:hypothetical protein